MMWVLTSFNVMIGSAKGETRSPQLVNAMIGSAKGGNEITSTRPATPHGSGKWEVLLHNTSWDGALGKCSAITLPTYHFHAEVLCNNTSHLPLPCGVAGRVEVISFPP